MQRDEALIQGNRVEDYEVEILDLNDQSLGMLESVEGGRIDYKKNAVIRSAGSVTVRLTEPVDWLKIRLKPWHVLQDPDGGEPFRDSLGVFVPSAPSTEVHDGYEIVSVELYDKLQLLVQDGPDRAYGVDAGVNAVVKIMEIMASLGQIRVIIPDSGGTLRTAMVWEADTTWLRIINDLLDAVGYFALWCDGDGAYRSAPYVRPAMRGVRREFLDDQWSILDEQVTVDQDLFSVPNRVKYISRSDGETPALVAVASNQNQWSPFSYQQRGRWITKTVANVDVVDQAVLQEMAERDLIASSSVSAGLSFSHAWVPLMFNDVVRLRHTSGGIDTLAVVENVSVALASGTLVSTTAQEVMDL